MLLRLCKPSATLAAKSPRTKANSFTRSDIGSRSPQKAPKGLLHFDGHLHARVKGTRHFECSLAIEFARLRLARLHDAEIETVVAARHHVVGDGVLVDEAERVAGAD